MVNLMCITLPFLPKELRLSSIVIHFICLYRGSKTSDESAVELFVSSVLNVRLFFKCERGFFLRPPGLYKLLLR